MLSCKFRLLLYFKALIYKVGYYLFLTELLLAGVIETTMEEYVQCSQIQSRHKWMHIDWDLSFGFFLYQFSSDQFSHSVVSDSLWPHESQHTRPPCPSPTPGVHSALSPSSPWCHPATSSSVVPFSSCPQSPQHQSLFQWVNSLHNLGNRKTSSQIYIEVFFF